MNAPLGTKKYRPYLTLDEIDTILTALAFSRSSPPNTLGPTPQLDRLIKDFTLLQFKANNDLIQESSRIVGTRKDRIRENIVNPDGPNNLPIDIPREKNVPISSIGARYAAYSKWLLTPHHVSEKVRELALTYRYENQLLSPDEEREFEEKYFKL